MGTDDARDAGRRAVRSLRDTLKERVADMLRRDPDRLAQAVELGLVNRRWVDDPTSQPFSAATPTEVVERYLERSVEQKPSVLASLGLSAIQILSSADDEGDGTAEQRQVVMFTDLEGFTRFTADAGDEAASELLARHRREAGPVIRSRGGRMVKRLGDGFMLTFLECEAAVLCGLELMDHQPEPLRLRVGMHVGDVMLTTDDVVGHTVNVAARVTESASGGQVLATTDVRAECELPRVSWGRARRRTFKGVGEPVSVCEVSWVR